MEGGGRRARRRGSEGPAVQIVALRSIKLRRRRVLAPRRCVDNQFRRAKARAAARAAANRHRRWTAVVILQVDRLEQRCRLHRRPRLAARYAPSALFAPDARLQLITCEVRDGEHGGWRRGTVLQHVCHRQPQFARESRVERLHSTTHTPWHAMTSCFRQHQRECHQPQHCRSGLSCETLASAREPLHGRVFALPWLSGRLGRGVWRLGSVRTDADPRLGAARTGLSGDASLPSTLAISSVSRRHEAHVDRSRTPTEPTTRSSVSHPRRGVERSLVVGHPSSPKGLHVAHAVASSQARKLHLYMGCCRTLMERFTSVHRDARTSRLRTLPGNRS